MLKNYTPKAFGEIFHLDFERKDGTGYCFPCDRAGVPDPEMPDEAKQNLEWCLNHPEEFETFNEIKPLQVVLNQAHGTCVCGEEVELYDQYYGACQCPRCGRWYNLFGQSLLPPDQWEEDPSEEEWR